MTPAERVDPAIIDGARRVRIANGSGTATSDVNALLKQFKEMQKMMKGFGKGGMGGALGGLGGLFGRGGPKMSPEGHGRHGRDGGRRSGPRRLPARAGPGLRRRAPMARPGAVRWRPRGSSKGRARAARRARAAAGSRPRPADPAETVRRARRSPVRPRGAHDPALVGTASHAARRSHRWETVGRYRQTMQRSSPWQ